MEQIITGAKGSSGSSDNGKNRGTEIASVAYMKILLALSEGEIAGGFTGRDIYLDGTPLLDDNGAENFSGVTWEWRSGSAAQRYIAGFPAVENEISTNNVELKYGTPWVKSITNTQLSAVRLRLSFPNGLYALRDSGGKNGYSVQYAVDLSTDGASYVTYGTDVASGIANSGYERSYRIDLPPAVSGWQIRVRRLTANSTDGRHADTTRIASMTEVVDAKLRYPNTSLLFVQLDSKLFDGQTPTITVKTKGLIIRVPSNYNPDTRVYTGTWDGTFKWAWSNNPAWVFYDLLLNPRYGLGKRITASQIDKWTLYQIAQYCDTQVSDGAGGKEARSLCDLYLSQRTDAWTVLMDLANIFQGMLSWSNNLLTVDADMPRALDPDFVFNKSNIAGSFSFSSTSEKTNYSAAIATYSNPDNGYKDDQASVYAKDLSARFGFNTLEMTAVGCTRESEAQRRALWAIETNRDDNAIEFKTGQEGRIPRVGKIIGINNARQAGRANGGRISAATTTKITLDRTTGAKVGDKLLINLPSGKAQSRAVSAVSGRVITVSTAYSELPAVEAAWVLDQTDLAIQQFRVKRVALNEDKTVTINALAYNPNKYARVESGAVIESRPVTVVPPRGQQAPANIVISSTYRVEQGIGITTMEVTWDRVTNAVAYEAQWRQDNGEWINVPRTGNNRFTVDGIYAGAYVVQVRAINALDITSVWAVSAETQLTGKVGKPPLPINFAATGINWGIKLSWNFPVGTLDTLKTEVQYSASADFTTPLLLSDVPYPAAEYAQMGLAAGKQFWYRARLVDRTGNMSDWTSVISGTANAQAEDYLKDIGDDLLRSADGKVLSDKIDFAFGSSQAGIDASLSAVLQNTLAAVDGANIASRQIGAARAEISDAKTTIADNQQAFAQFKELTAAQFSDNNAVVSSVKTAQASADKAFAENKTVVQAQLDQANSSIATVQQAQATADKAFSEHQQQVTSVFDSQQAAINQKLTAYTDATSATSIYSLKVGVKYDGKYYDAGLSVSTIADGTGIKTRTAINADQFVMLSGSNGAQYSPFAVVNGSVFLDAGFIRLGSITNAMIGAYIQSDNYIPGTTGWRIDKAGLFEINGVTAGQGSLKITSTALIIRDGTGRVRVKIGDLNAS